MKLCVSGDRKARLWGSVPPEDRSRGITWVAELRSLCASPRLNNASKPASYFTFSHTIVHPSTSGLSSRVALLDKINRSPSNR